MTAVTANPGSFRDPGSRVYEQGDKILRWIGDQGVANYESARDAGVLDRLIGDGFFVSSKECERGAISGNCDASYVLEHERIPFVSYPYEWSFSLLKRAAMFHIDLHLRALEQGFTLTDATAYNIQFKGTRPIGIDHLSLKPYEVGEIWAGHRQFCMQFLNPLILWSRKGVAPNSWFRGSLEGITPEDLAPLMALRDMLSFTVLSHVIGQASLQRRAVAKGKGIPPKKRSKLSRTGMVGMLQGLRGFIEKCEPPLKATVWGEYADNTSYEVSERSDKGAFVAEMVAASKPEVLFDLGCNSGEYSEIALKNGAGYVVGFDFDFGALEAAVGRADKKDLNFLPLWLDAANPSPSQGWAQAERSGLSERGEADALVALAFIHHIVVGKNVPMDMAVAWIISMAPKGIIEFPPKNDLMVQRLLANRTDIFPDYGEGSFLAAVTERAKVVKTRVVSKSGRMLLWYDRT
jgi:ribosomal protein L11 methylase PrmA